MENSPWDFDRSLLELPKENVTIKGHLVSFRYFENIASRVFETLFSKMNKILVTKAEHFIHQAKNHYSSRNDGHVPRSVCVHVRRGDKATQHALEHGMRVPEAVDILQAMTYMESKHEHVVFIVASDSKQWCSKYISPYGDNVFVSNLTSVYEDFVLMSSCDDMIMTVGTFGWWASWLTSQRGGTSMYYKHPFTTETAIRKKFYIPNHFPPNWKAYYNE